MEKMAKCVFEDSIALRETTEILIHLMAAGTKLTSRQSLLIYKTCDRAFNEALKIEHRPTRLEVLNDIRNVVNRYHRTDKEDMYQVSDELEKLKNDIGVTMGMKSFAVNA